MSDKKSARQAQLRLLGDFAQKPQKKLEEALLYQQLRQLPIYQQAQSIGFTMSEAIEVNTLPLIEAAWKAGKTVYLPRVMPQHQMTFIRYLPTDQLVRSKFGVLEPELNETQVKNSPDLLITPGLAYDMTSHMRLGFGGGHYDRYLAKYQPTTVALALSIQTRTTAEWSIGRFDLPIDTILTVPMRGAE